MHVGVTKNPWDLRIVLNATKTIGHPAAERYYTFDQLYRMTMEDHSSYLLILLLDDDGAYLGHVILNVSELIMGRVRITDFFMARRRDPWLLYWFYSQIEILMCELFTEDTKIRMERQLDEQDMKWQTHVEYYGSYIKEAVLREFVKGRNYIQYYKLLKGRQPCQAAEQ